MSQAGESDSEPTVSMEAKADHGGRIFQVARGNLSVGSLGGKSLPVIAATMVVALILAVLVIIWPTRAPAKAGSGSIGGSPSYQPDASVASIQAKADWCCKYVQSVYDMRPVPAKSRGVYAGTVYIEIVVTTNSSEAIPVGLPQVAVQVRGPEPTGDLGITPGPPEGGGQSEGTLLHTDIDSRAPVTLPGPSGTAQDRPSLIYYWVTAGSPEVFILQVTDMRYDCFFDLKMTYQAAGHNRIITLNDNGSYFHMIGSSA